MRGSGGCGRSLGAGGRRGYACTGDPQPKLFIPTASVGVEVAESPFCSKRFPAKARRGTGQEVSPESGAVR